MKYIGKRGFRKQVKDSMSFEANFTVKTLEDDLPVARPNIKLQQKAQSICYLACVSESFIPTIPSCKKLL